MSTTPEVFTIAEAATVLRVPEGWLRKKITAGLVPHTRLGKHVRFTAGQLELILDQGATHAKSPPQPRTSGISPRARLGTKVVDADAESRISRSATQEPHAS